MKRFDNRYLWGGLLIVVGILFLLQEIGIVSSAWGVFWGVLFGLAGAIFLYTYSTNTTQWWTLIPGFSLLGISAIILLSELVPGFEDGWGGAIVLGSIGLSFWIIFFRNQEMWWAIIPGGVLFVLAIVSVFDLIFVDSSIDVGGIFLMGLGLVFAVLAIIPTPQGKLLWALIPAGVLFIIGLLVSTPSLNLFNYIWPAALIIIGAYILFRNLLIRR
jgi:hypothetical protein